jgi:hypothetical protein
MATAHPFATTQPFDAATCDAMGLAFEAAWHKLLISGSALAIPECAEATREDLAMHIIDLTKSGERNVDELRDRAIAQLRRAKVPSVIAKTEKTTDRALELMQRSRAALAAHVEQSAHDHDLLAQFRDAVARSRGRLSRRD